MGRIVAFLYGTVAYLLFLAVFLYAIGFIENMVVPQSVDAGGPSSLLGQALLINVALLSIFAVQHSVMARPGFKALWTKIVPEPVERSTYVLFANAALALLFWQWRPMTGEVWNVAGSGIAPVLVGLSFAGWGLVLASTILINHFDLFGMRQVYLHLTSREYAPIGFRTPLFYRFVRHPLMLGFMIAFWATPTMTAGHLLFAAVTTVYMLIAIQLEERDLVTYHGEDYERYRSEVSMIIPMPPKRSAAPSTAETSAPAAPAPLEPAPAVASPAPDAPPTPAPEREPESSEPAADTADPLAQEMGGGMREEPDRTE